MLDDGMPEQLQKDPHRLTKFTQVRELIWVFAQTQKSLSPSFICTRQSRSTSQAYYCYVLILRPNMLKFQWSASECNIKATTRSKTSLATAPRHECISGATMPLKLQWHMNQESPTTRIYHPCVKDICCCELVAAQNFLNIYRSHLRVQGIGNGRGREMIWVGEGLLTQLSSSAYEVQFVNYNTNPRCD
jgi:hypothetical protein